jgi:hypothetical protein
LEGSLVERFESLHASKWKEEKGLTENKWCLSTNFAAKGLKYIVKK